MTHDLVVLGAGPAGMSAAVTAAELGVKTLLLDEQPRAGGQIYRNVAGVPAHVGKLLGPDYLAGRALVEKFAASGVELRSNSLAWDVSPDLGITALQDGHAFQVRAKQLIAATGAMERASPIPGWTLPGVMNAGAAQIAMKSGSAIPAGRIALVGAGPLLLLVTCQLLQAGAQVVALIETSEPGNSWAAVKHLPAALKAPEYLLKGLKMLMRLRRAGVPWFKGARDLRVLGAERAEGLSFTCNGRSHVLEVETVLLHHGVIPNHQLSRLLRVEHAWDPVHQAWQVVCDAHGQTSLPGFRMAGDGVAIAGALAAQASGALAALGSAHTLGRIDEAELNRRSAAHRRELARQAAVRPFLDVLYRPPAFITNPPDETVVCRCEEVTAGRIRQMAGLGCQGPNQTKFFSRCGMGPCQGRVCGNVVTQILAASLGKTPDAIGAYRIRAPLKPVPMSAVAGLASKSLEEK